MWFDLVSWAVNELFAALEKQEHGSVTLEASRRQRSTSNSRRGGSGQEAEYGSGISGGSTTHLRLFLDVRALVIRAEERLGRLRCCGDRRGDDMVTKYVQGERKWFPDDANRR